MSDWDVKTRCASGRHHFIHEIGDPAWKFDGTADVIYYPNNRWVCIHCGEEKPYDSASK